LNLEGGICCYTKVFFRPDIDLDLEFKVLDDEVMKQEAMSNEL